MNDEHEHVCECGATMTCKGEDAIDCRLPREARCGSCVLAANATKESAA